MAVKSVIFAHCSDVHVQVGQKVNRGDKLYTMGSTGYSTGNHVHITVVDGEWTRPWYRDDYIAGRANPLSGLTESFKTAKMFLFGGKYMEPFITHGFWEMRSSGYHFGLDVVTDRSYLGEVPYGLWDNPIPGVVTAVGDDRSETSYGYGKYVIVCFDDAPVIDPEGIHIVKAGDTLGAIASKYGTTYQELARINAIANPNLIYPGQKIKLTGSEAVYYKVVSGDTLVGIARRYSMSLRELLALNGQVKNPDLIHPGDKIRVK